MTPRQPPQCSTVVDGTSQPLAESSSQSAQPAAQVGRHLPPTQALAPVPAFVLQDRPQLPQWSTSVLVSTQAPPQLVLPAPVAVQSVVPPGHEVMHTPAEQT